MRTLMLVLLAIGLLAVPAFAGNGAPNGAHYNLNIIGVEKAKTVDMTNSDRHTIFVELNNQDDTHSNIYLTPGDFQVCDGNAFDAAYSCSGNVVGSQGAVFQLPCNTNLPTDPYTLIACSVNEPAAYTVWARALGSPKGSPSATMTTCATDPVTGEQVCSTENVLLIRQKGKSTFRNVTNELTSLVADIDGDGTLERVSLFAGGLEDWLWQYANKGLRLAQLRFYLQ
jgi:hypothetical protein